MTIPTVHGRIKIESFFLPRHSLDSSLLNNTYEDQLLYLSHYRLDRFLANKYALASHVYLLEIEYNFIELLETGNTVFRSMWN